MLLSNPRVRVLVSLLASVACSPPTEEPRDGEVVRDAGPTRGADGALARDDAGPITPRDAGPPGEQIPILVVMGHGARTMVSCDEGETWVGDHFESTDFGDHGPYASRALVAGHGVFVRHRGWGGGDNTGAISRSLDGGFTWIDETVADGLFSGAFGDGVFVLAGSGRVLRSIDDGESWSTPIAIAPGHAVIGFGGGNFVVCGDDACQYSEDDGVTWLSSTIGTGCGGGGAIHYGNGTFVHATGGNPTCYSDDDGATWSRSNDTGWGDFAYHDGDRFVRGAYEIASSPDARDWTLLGEFGGGRRSGDVVRSPSGTYVFASGDAIVRTSDFEDFELFTPPAPASAFGAIVMQRLPRPAGCDGP